MCLAIGGGNMQYVKLINSILFLIACIVSVVRWFIIKKDFGLLSFIAVSVTFVAFVLFLILFIMDIH